MLSGNSENFRRPSMVSIKMLASSAFKGKTPGGKVDTESGKTENKSEKIQEISCLNILRHPAIYKGCFSYFYNYLKEVQRTHGIVHIMGRLTTSSNVCRLMCEIFLIRNPCIH